MDETALSDQLDTRPDTVDLETSPDAVFEAVEKLKFYLSCEAELYLNIGKMLTLLTANKKYRLYGSHIQTKDDFFKEIGLARSTAYVYMDVWRTFGHHLAGTTLSVPYRRLIEALPLATDDNKAAEWIEKAEHLLPNDYKAAIHKEKTGIDDLVCEHTDVEIYAKCTKCNKWIKQSG